MWIRSAFWIGAAHPGAEDVFRNAVDRDLIDCLRQLPGVRSARALWPRRLEQDPPAIACQVLVEFDNVDDIDTMLASQERAELRARVVEVAALFDGVISHIDYEAV